ncbi:MAG: glycosyltransferase [Proteobacteria bacterium]|nr:glycosyltransferase [Pseudomonadota bacterium]
MTIVCTRSPPVAPGTSEFGPESTLPLVTVLTPSFNQRGLLAECLDCVATQTYPEVEHIVVDGGSRDGTVELLQSWATGSRRMFLSEPDGGMYDALNKGLGLARGELLTYLNCDDLYFPYSLEALVEGWQRTGADVVFGDMVRAYEDGRVVFKLQPAFDRGFYGFYYQLAQPTALWTVELAGRLGGFDASLRFGGDADFFLRAGALGARFAKVDEVVCLERHGAACLSAAHRTQHRGELAAAAARAGVWRGSAEKAVMGPLRVLRGLARQLALSASFTRERRLPSAVRWQRFLASGCLDQLHVGNLLLNVLPAPLLRRKRSAGVLDWGAIQSAREGEK